MGSPWLKFYTADWRSEPTLKLVSRAARSLWLDIICLIHEAGTGRLEINGQMPTEKQLADVLGDNPRTIRKLLSELELRGVCSRDEEGFIVSRRIIRDRIKAQLDIQNGSKGGNPSFKNKDLAKKGVNPLIPEARSQILEKKKSTKKEVWFEEVFWPDASAMWKRLGRPPGSKQSALNRTKRMSVEECENAHLLLPLFEAEILEARKTFPDRSPPDVCRYLWTKDGPGWWKAHECEIEVVNDDDEALAPSGAPEARSSTNRPADPPELFDDGGGVDEGPRGPVSNPGLKGAGGSEGPAGLARLPQVDRVHGPGLENQIGCVGSSGRRWPHHVVVSDPIPWGSDGGHERRQPCCDRGVGTGGCPAEGPDSGSNPFSIDAPGGVDFGEFREIAVPTSGWRH